MVCRWPKMSFRFRVFGSASRCDSRCNLRNASGVDAIGSSFGSSTVVSSRSLSNMGANAGCRVSTKSRTASG